MKVLLTGSSSGLGLEIAKYLLKNNNYVILHYNSHSEEIKK